MKHLLLSLALVSPLAMAGPIENMTAQCRCVESGGVCKVNNDRLMKPGTRKFVNGGTVPAEVYNEIKALGKGMCDDIAQAHATGSRRFNEGYRWMFRKEPVDCFIPPK
jgi:hypothetical protein